MTLTGMFVQLFYICFLQMLLNDEEIKLKTSIWMAENADYLKTLEGIDILFVGTQELHVRFMYKYEKTFKKHI